MSASGTDPLSYQWQLNGVNIPGATTTSLVLNNVQASDAGTYQVVVSNAAGSVTSAAALVVNTPPSVTTQPVSRTVNAGANVTFVVQAIGSPPLFYQWQFNGVDVPGATGQVLNLTNVQASDAGGYRATISNIAGSVASAAAILTVNTSSGTTPVTIVAQAQSQASTVGANVALCVTVFGGTPMGFQWALNGVPLSDGGNLSGTASSCLAILNTQLTNAGTYTVTVSNAVGAVTSDPAVLLVDQPGAQVDFSNLDAGVNGLVFDADGVTRLSGAGYLAQLYAGPTGNSLAAVGPAVPFMTGDLAGYWSVLPDAIRTVPTVAPGDPAFLQARVWQSGKGLTFEQAAAAGSRVGQSAVQQVATPAAGPPPVPPAPWTAFQGFTLQSPLAISVQPAPQAVSIGGTAVFNVTAAGTGPFSFQWQFNGSPIAGATNATLSLANVQPVQAGNYNVIVSSAAGSVASTTVTLMVLTPPSITTGPVSQTVAPGANVSFSVIAAGTAPLSFQWQANGTPLSGATNATLTLPSVQPAQAGNYSVTVSNAAGSVASAPATLTVLVMPSITTGPVSQTVVSGANVTFGVIAAGTGPLDYQWQFNGALLAGATNATLTLTNVQPAQTGGYNVVVHNTAGTTASTAATLTVLTPPTITTGPISQAVVVGTNVTFTVIAASLSPLNYQWQFNGAPIPGATNATLTLTNVQPAQAGGYNVAVRNSAGTVASTAALLTVLLPPTILTGPVSQTVIAGTNVTFSASASGSSPLSYQWNFSGTSIAGATDTALALTNVQAAQAGSYSVTVTNAAGSITSTVAVLTVLIPPAIATQPVSQTVIAGTNVTFTVTATGSSPLSYQWSNNGTTLIAATNAALSLTNIQSAQAGNYTVTVTNAAGSITSAVATLTLLVPPAISTGPVSQTVIAGTNVTFSASVSGSSPLSYQWSLDGTTLAGATNAALSLTNIQSAQAGNYTVTVTNAAGSITSAPATLTVLVPPTITTGPASQTVIAGTNVTFIVTATGTGPLAYQWRFDGTAIVGATNASLILTNVQAGQAGAYSVVVTNAAGQAVSAIANLSLTAPLRFSNNPSLANGTFQVTVTGSTGANIRIDVSTNLVNWLPLATLTNFSGQAIVTDPQAGNFSRRFYRAVVATPVTAPLQFSTNAVFSSGGFQVTLTGSSGTGVRVDFSTNLVNWLPLANITNFSGQAVVSDPQAAGNPHRFYRAVVTP